MKFQNRSQASRSISPRQELVRIEQRSQSPVITKEYIQNTKFYNRFYRQEQRYRLLQEQIDAEIKAKANKKKITENSYRIVTYYLQERIGKVLQKFNTTNIDFSQIGTIFTELQIFDVIIFDEHNQLIVDDHPLNTRGKQEMLMHELFWNLLSQDGKLENVDAQLINYFLRVLMDPVKLSVDETGELLLDMLNYDLTKTYQQKIDQAKRLVIQFRALTQNKLFTYNQDKRKDHENKIKEQQLRELTFIPAINEKSKILASQNRNKYLEQQMSTTLFGDSIITEQKSPHSKSCIDIMLKKHEINTEKLKQKQFENEQIKMKECTFHPIINTISQNYTNQDVVSRLYTEESIHQKRIHQEQYTQFIRENREQEELKKCTFQPIVNEGISYNNPSTPKDYERTVGRMRYAKEQAKQKYDKMNHVPIGENFEKLKNSPFNPPQMVNRQKVKRKPIVIMDVNICPGKQGRLALYEDEDPQDVVKNFSKLFNLNPEMSLILLNVLEQERQKLVQQ